jgi:hypothetical protein
MRAVIVGLRNTSDEGTIRRFPETKNQFRCKGESEWRTSGKQNEVR